MGTEQIWQSVVVIVDPKKNENITITANAVSLQRDGNKEWFDMEIWS